MKKLWTIWKHALGSFDEERASRADGASGAGSVAGPFADGDACVFGGVAVPATPENLARYEDLAASDAPAPVAAPPRPRAPTVTPSARTEYLEGGVRRGRLASRGQCVLAGRPLCGRT